MGADAASLNQSQSEGTFAHRIAHQNVASIHISIRPRGTRMQAGGVTKSIMQTHLPERPLDGRIPLASPGPLGRAASDPFSFLPSFSHLVCCGRVGACRQERVEGLEVAVGGGPVSASAAIL